MTEFRPRPFNLIPPVIKNLLIINVLVFFAQSVFERSFPLDNMFALHDVHSVYFRPHQLITHMFMHGGLGHLFGNMLALWMFGSQLENVWGAKRFLIFYMVSGLGSAFLHLIILYFEMVPVMEIFRSLPYEEQQSLLYDPRFKPNGATVGASGAVFGCLAATAYLFPNSPVMFSFFFPPIPAKWFVLGYAGLELYLGIQNSAGDNVAHWAHLGGAGVGFILVWFWNKNNRRTFY